jgi:predicted permease
VTKSLLAAQSTYPGFDPGHVATVSIDLRQNGYDRPRGLAFYRRLLDVARAEPGVESATLAAATPLGLLEVRTQPIAIDGYVPAHDENLEFMFNTIGPDYLRTLRIGLPYGREFRDRDDESATPVAIVNTTLAERFWGGGASALGKRIRVGDDWRTIVGVASDVKYARINELPRPYVYVPLMQAYSSNMVLHLRGPGPVEDLVKRARVEVASLDANLPIMFSKSLTDRVQGAIVPYRLTATMLFIFGVAGMILAALGTYGLVSYTVRQSTHEIGIRMALGATAASVVRVFLSRGLWLGGIGAAIGVTVALAASRLIRSALFGVSTTDPMSFSGALAIVLGGVLLATFVPAWRASRTDPLRALRHQ